MSAQLPLGVELSISFESLFSAGDDSVGERLSSMPKALGSIPSSAEKNRTFLAQNDLVSSKGSL